jgi:hypothetical protein
MRLNMLRLRRITSQKCTVSSVHMKRKCEIAITFHTSLLFSFSSNRTVFRETQWKRILALNRKETLKSSVCHLKLLVKFYL